MYRTQEQRAAAIEAERAAGHQCKIGLDKRHRRTHTPGIPKAYTTMQTRYRASPCANKPANPRNQFRRGLLWLRSRRSKAEASRCLHCKNPRCVAACPVSIRIPDFIGALHTGELQQAADIIAGDSSLPSICGRVARRRASAKAPASWASKANRSPSANSNASSATGSSNTAPPRHRPHPATGTRSPSSAAARPGWPAQATLRNWATE